jgi:hypothetical protein
MPLLSGRFALPPDLVGHDRAVSHSDQAVIVVANDASWNGDQRLGTMTVYVDGRRVGSAPPEGKAVIAVTPGDYAARIRQWWYRSAVLTVNVGVGDRRRLAGNRPNGLVGFARLLLQPFHGLTLSPTDDR